MGLFRRTSAVSVVDDWVKRTHVICLCHLCVGKPLQRKVHIDQSERVVEDMCSTEAKLPRSVVASFAKARHARTPCLCQFQFLKPYHKEERYSGGVTCASAQRMSYRFSVRYPSTDPAYHPSSPIHCASTASPIAKARPSLLHWRDVSMQPLFALSLRVED
jgi:hypothetical protein